MDEEKNASRVGPLKAGAGRQDLPRRSQRAEVTDPTARKLATMLGYIARQMRTKNQGRISVPQEDRHHALCGFDRFSLEDVELAQLEAERVARRTR